MLLALTKTLSELKLSATNRVEAKTDLLVTTYLAGQLTSGDIRIFFSQITDAKAYVAAGSPSDATPFPWVKSIGDRLSLAYAVVAAILIDIETDWNTYGSQVENERVIAVTAISTATTAAGIYIIEHDFNTAVDAL